MNYQIFSSRLGYIAISAESDAITSITILSDERQRERNKQKTNTWFEPDKNSINETSPVIEQCRQEINEYLNAKRKNFSVKLAPKGTEFQQNVWSKIAMLKIGQSESYQDIAVKLNKPKASRAVGTAVGKNPIAIIIPCHRIIAQSRKLTGYAWGLDVKEQLLKLENIQYAP